MKKLLAKYRDILKSRKKTLWFSAITSFLLLMLCYFADNISYSILSGPSVGQRIEQAKELIGIAKDEHPKEYVFINVAYDKELVPVNDEFGLPKGDIDITNRGRLTEFISKVGDGHKFILMDVLLSSDYISASDSLLIDAISNIDRLSIARSSTNELLDSCLFPKAGYTDYSTDILETNFVKYEFLKNGEPTMPYQASMALNTVPNIHKFGPFYISDGHFCWKSLTLRFPIKLWEENDKSTLSENMMAEKVLLNLGSDILDVGVDIPKLVKDKIVVIGDFTEDDIHDTYIGKIAGPVINVNALEALRNSELIIPWSFIIFLFVLYTIMGNFAVRNIGLTHKLLAILPVKSDLAKYLLSFVGYSFLLTLVAVIVYLTTGMDMNILIPTLWFTLLNGFTKTFAS